MSTEAKTRRTLDFTHSQRPAPPPLLPQSHTTAERLISRASGRNSECNNASCTLRDDDQKTFATSAAAAAAKRKSRKYTPIERTSTMVNKSALHESFIPTHTHIVERNVCLAGRYSIVSVVVFRAGCNWISPRTSREIKRNCLRLDLLSNVFSFLLQSKKIIYFVKKSICYIFNYRQLCVRV